MGIDFEKTIKQSLAAPFKDKKLIKILLIFGIINFLFSFATVAFVLNSFSSFFASGGFLTAVTSGHYGGLLSAAVDLVLGIAGLIFISVLISILLTNMVVSKVYFGKSFKIKDSLKYALSRYLSVLGVYIIEIILLLIIPAIVLIGLFILIHAFAVIFLILYLFLLLYSGIKLSIAVPISLIGKKNPIDSVKSSWKITRNNWWTIFGVFLILWIIVFAASYIISFPSTSYLRGNINSEVLNITVNSTYNSTVNSSIGHTQAVLQKTFSIIGKNFYSPVYLVVLLITELITIFINAWLIVAPVILYMQLAQAKGTTKRKR